nr:probable LRR receptor-like serine/threonine-protein kinase At1g56140 isoform X1 [Ipomoea batatas]
MKVKFLPSGVGPMKNIITIIIIAIAIFAPHKLLPPALAQTTATLDPTEARILNSIFQKWGILANNLQWNLSGQLCTGFAVDSTSMQDTAYNPAIKCTCSSTVCHITALKVQAQDVTGGIPDELWNLTSINDLNLGQNYLNGTLSRSIGNLRRLQYLTVGKNALSGVLPKELGLLTDLRSFSISTNNFSGSLPSELGNLKKLTQLYIDSSGVSGPIPPSFANLLNLETVWASDIELTGRIPDFIGNWAKLNTLRISDLLNGNSSLDFIRNMKNLSKLVLRNNNISASIPSNIGEYQSLSLLALPSGLNCLQKNFPCHRGKPIYSSFAIKCGGQQITSSNELLFERDNETLGPATYYMTSTGRWAVSNVGLPSDSTAPEYTCHRGDPIYSSFAIKCGGQEITSSNQIVYETDNATLGPATYYMTSTGRWAGSLKEKDFDIKKLAGGSLRGLSRQYKVQVSENHMDIHLYWAGKGTCCIPSQGTYGPLISAISATPGNTRDGRTVAVKSNSLCAPGQGKRSFVAEVANLFLAVQHATSEVVWLGKLHENNSDVDVVDEDLTRLHRG